MSFIAPGHLLSPLLPWLFIEGYSLIYYYIYISSVISVCLCFFFRRILHVVHWVEFDELAFFVHGQNIVVFVLAELFGYLLIVFVIVSHFGGNIYVYWYQLLNATDADLPLPTRFCCKDSFLISLPHFPYKKIWYVIISHVFMLVIFVNPLLLHILFIILYAF